MNRILIILGALLLSATLAHADAIPITGFASFDIVASSSGLPATLPGSGATVGGFRISNGDTQIVAATGLDFREIPAFLTPAFLCELCVNFACAACVGGTGAFERLENTFTFDLGVPFSGQAWIHYSIQSSGAVVPVMVDGGFVRPDDTGGTFTGSGLVAIRMKPLLAFGDDGEIILTGDLVPTMNFFNFTGSFSPIPEPATWALLGSGLIGMMIRRLRWLR